MRKRNYRKNRDNVPDRYKKVIANLHVQFGEVMHDLWDDDDFNVPWTRLDFAKSIRAKHMDDLTDHELDYLTWTATTTMGGVSTLKFVLPRFFAAYFANPDYVWTVFPEVLKGKFERAGIDEWSVEEQVAVLEALIAFEQHEIERFPDLEYGSVTEWACGLLDNLRRS